MKRKKSFALLLILFQLLAIFPFSPASHAAGEGEQKSTVTAKMVDSAPVIDGKLTDSIWSLSNNVSIPLTATVPHSASFDVKWDYTYLYVAVSVKGDSDLVAGSAWVSSDVVSIFLDPTKHASGPYVNGDWQIGIGYNPDDNFNPYILMGAGIAQSAAEQAALKRNILAVTAPTSEGWNAEIAIPWKSLGLDSYLQREFGFNLAVDNMASGTLYSSVWCASNGVKTLWNTTASFGILKLSGDIVNNTDGDVIYSENFNGYADGTLPSNYTPISGQQSGWSVSGGKLIGSFNTSGASQRRISIPALGDNFTMSVDIAFINYINTSRWLSAYYRAPLSNSAGYYHFSNRAKGAGEISSYTSAGSWLYFVDTNSDGTALTALEKNATYNLSVSAFGQDLHHVRSYEVSHDTKLISFDRSYNTYDKFGTDLTNCLERGRFGLQVDQSIASFDNIVIRKLEVSGISVSGIPDSVKQLETITLSVGVGLSDGSSASVNLKDARIYSSDSGILKVCDDKTIKALKTGTATVSVIVGNKLYTKSVTVNASEKAPAITSLTPDEKLLKTVVNSGIAASSISFSAIDETFTESKLNGASAGISWSSSDSSVVAYDALSSSFTALKKGTATITATMDGVSSEITVWVRESASDRVFIYADFEDGMLPASWSKIGTSGSYSIESETVDKGDGKTSSNRYLAMGKSTRILIPMPKGAGDYEIEGDITFTQADNSSRWASIMYRIQNKDYPYFQFAIRQTSTASNGTEFAFRNASNAWDVRQKAPFTENMELGAKHHMKVVVYRNKIKQYLDGIELEFADNAGDFLTGDIGLQTDLASVRFDNIKVSFDPDPLPDVPRPDAQYANAKILNGNLVNCPTVICNGPASLANINTLINDSVTSSILLDLRLKGSVLCAYSGLREVGALSDVISAASGKLIMMFNISDADTASALASYISQNKIEDLNVVSDNIALLQSFRALATKTRASLRINDISIADPYAVAQAANRAYCMSVIIPQSAAAKDAVEKIQGRMLGVFVVCDDTAAGMHKAITSGANGIITGDPEGLYKASRIYDSPTLTRRSFVIGHRGIPSLSPENTMASYRMAVEEYGADMVETDVYLTKDGHVIILHDTTFSRTTDIKETTALADSVFTDAGTTRAACTPGKLTLEQIRKLDAGSWYGSAFAGEKIPTLDELLQYVKAKNITLVLELKDASDGIEQACVDLVKKYDCADNVNFITFNQKSIPIMKTIAPQFAIATLSGISVPDSVKPNIALRDVLNSILPNNAAYDASYSYITDAGFIRNANARGLGLWGWTYADKSSYAWAIDNGITGLTGNNSNFTKSYVFDLKPESSSYSLDVGGSLNLLATAHANLAWDSRLCSPAVAVISGAENISVSGSSITGLKSGTATILMSTSSAMDASAYKIYSQPVTITVNTVLKSITAPTAVTGLPNGTPKTASALRLPSKVTILTGDGSAEADIEWDVASCSYDTSSAGAQTFTVSGTVTLPEGVVNPDGVPLKTSVSVTVNGAVGSGGNTATPGTSPVTVVTGGSTATARVNVPAVTASNGVASASVTSSQISAMVEASVNKAKEQNAQAALEIRVDKADNASGISVSIPQSSLSAMTSGNIDKLTLSSSSVTMSFDSTALAEIGGNGAGAITISATKSDLAALSDNDKALLGNRPVYDLKIVSDSKTISSFGGGTATVSIPYKPSAGEEASKIVVYYVSGSGELIMVPDCVYDPSSATVTFKTTHFSSYAVAYNDVAFSDVSGWYEEYVGFLAARKIINGMGNGKFSPDTNITRAQFVTILANLHGGNLGSYSASSFTDVKAGDWYFTAAQWAHKLGIATGYDGKFDPDAAITRQDMAVMISRYADKAANYTLRKSVGAVTFTDSSEISPYAAGAVTAMQQAGLISGNGDGSFAPKANATRAQAAKIIALLIRSRLG